MIVRVWNTGYDPARLDDFIAFARERLEPFFRAQDGCLGCFFTHDAVEWRTITFWRDQKAVDTVKDSDIYRTILLDLVNSGLLLGGQQTRIMTVAGGGLFGPLPL